jgi:cell division protein FtsQ
VSGLVRAEALFRARRRATRSAVPRPLLALAVATTIAGSAVWVGWESPILRLERVSVNGTSRLSAAEVLEAARVRVGSSLLATPVAAMAHRVQELPAVATVHIRREWPHGLVIEVTERRPVAAVAVAPGVAELLDATGTAFATAPGAQAGLVALQVPPLSIGTATPAARAALTVWRELPAAVRREIRTIAASSGDDVSFTLARGATVIWGSAADEPDKLSALAVLLRAKATVYDVSTPSVAVTR